jgi:acetoin utilization deacetylase AcuC-like enzyme
MQFFYSDDIKKHHPTDFYRRGTVISHPEQPDRSDTLRTALKANGFEEHAVSDFGLAPIKAVHDPGYVEFLSGFWPRRAEIDANATEFLSTQFPRMEMSRRPGGLAGQLGYYTSDTSTPILEGTWQAVYQSAQTALSAADAATATDAAYALCRPPGHHAFAAAACGFCYLNNSAIAAQHLRQKLGGPVAVLDIDVHHGNGTQEIFYPRNDVLTVSLHADTNNYFPFFAGYADETGTGDGAGYNINHPLAHHTSDDAYLPVLETALKQVTDYRPAALVVALGLDASEHDPIGVLDITTSGFEAIGRMIGQVATREGLPTVLIQEGGYMTTHLPDNLIAFLKGYRGG